MPQALYCCACSARSSHGPARGHWVPRPNTPIATHGPQGRLFLPFCLFYFFTFYDEDRSFRLPRWLLAWHEPCVGGGLGLASPLGGLGAFLLFTFSHWQPLPTLFNIYARVGVGTGASKKTQRVGEGMAPPLLGPCVLDGAVYLSVSLSIFSMLPLTGLRMMCAVFFLPKRSALRYSVLPNWPA